jgi:hypothetical protein
MSDYLPRREDQFFNWQNNLLTVLASAPAGWNVPTEAVTNLTDYQAPYVDAYGVANSGKRTTRTTQQVKEKQDTQKLYEKSIRQFVRQFLAFNPGVTNSERSQLGLPDLKPGRTPSPTPTAIPNVSEEPLPGARFKIAAKEALNGKTLGKNGKPAGVSGFELAYWIGDNPPVNGDACYNRSRHNRNTAIIQLNAADAGKKIIFFMRWIGMKNQTGPWSAGVMDVIPM